MRGTSGAYLVLATPQSLEGGGAVRVTGSDGHEDLTDVDTGNETVGLSEGTTHSGLQSIGTSARQHLVDTDDVVGVDTDAEMETFLSGNLDEVLVGANTGGLKSLGGQLLVLVGDEVDAEGEVVYAGLLATEVEDPDLGIGYTTVEPALGVLRQCQSAIPPLLCSVALGATYGLVLAVAVATGGTAGHCDDWLPAEKSMRACSSDGHDGLAGRQGCVREYRRRLWQRLGRAGALIATVRTSLGGLVDE